MSNSTTAIADNPHLGNELACYVQTDKLEMLLPAIQALEATHKIQYKAQKLAYQLSLGELQLSELVVYLPEGMLAADIESVRKTAIKAVLAWHKGYLSGQKADIAQTIEVLVFDIQFKSDIEESSHVADKDSQHGKYKRLKHDFPARYFMEDLIIDMSDNGQLLQIFGWHDWQSILTALHTPCELWRFLRYRLEQLQQSAINHVPSFESEEALINNFVNSSTLFTQAIAIDNALIKYGMQDAPNAALIAMALAQKNHSPTSQMYQQHMQQAAILWSQLSSQMITMVNEMFIARKGREQQVELSHWQQQILDESFFSRHELVRTLYRHPKQQQSLQQQGYVVHQHSYERLGRHYVLIFYGQDAEGQHSKKAIQPNLAKIALDVATRLPIAELHHVIVLGIDFITEDKDSFMDIDLWIQPVDAMSQRERQLSKQLQRLQQQSQK
ncbi:hypothetical protein [Psychrobacter sp. ANT_H3]|uniref:hypothetical protein n=1 Tax=Psychrobacter sp. ANT_H3 TaxID=3019444 RepID=UPI0022F185B4|nr:hypothetical protein [Psychrobacter sp. ANT_H3]MDA5134237.1 hypothetical protein [Psychrobacter sp. ANT_H3]